MDAQLDAFVDQRLGQFHRDWSSLVGYSLNEPRRAPSPDVLGGTARDWMEPSGVRTAIMSSVGVNAQGDVASMLDPLTKFRQDVKATARSGASAAHNAAVLAIARANTSAIRGVVAVATLDARTTELCISRHGASWDVVSGDPLPESTSQESFPGRPPWHFNCRTTLVPVFASFEYPSLQDADKWLSSRAGKAALGPRRVALWEAGRITRNQLIDQDGRPQLIEDLQHV
jgi:hypothetical protein